MSTRTATTRHVVTESPIEPSTLVRRVGDGTGKLTGYAGGLDRKQYPLELEKATPVAPQRLW